MGVFVVENNKKAVTNSLYNASRYFGFSCNVTIIRTHR